MLFNFGWIPGLLFGLLVLITVLYYSFRCIFFRDDRRHFFLCSLLFVTSFAGFGLLELDYELGQLPFTLFFVACYFLFEKKKETTAQDIG